MPTDNSTIAWERLTNVLGVLNRKPTSPVETYRDAVENVLAVDRWLWFLALENLFADDDSYWNKGADNRFYYEPECGRLHPIEHDGHEAFVPSRRHLLAGLGRHGRQPPRAPETPWPPRAAPAVPRPPAHRARGILPPRPAHAAD